MHAVGDSFSHAGAGDYYAAIEGIVEDFRELGVQKVAPCHYTGDQAMKMFAAEYEEDFVKAGVGRVLNIGP